MEPIQRAASCLGPVKIITSPGGRTEPNRTHSWTLNAEKGVGLGNGWHFEAQMHYRLLQRPVSREWRVTTEGYRYRLALHGTHLWRIHWHPTLTSDYHLPHVHLNLTTPPGEVGTDLMGQHHPTGRMTFEDALEWVFLNVPAKREDWRQVLEETRLAHIEHRSWSTRPPR